MKKIRSQSLRMLLSFALAVPALADNTQSTPLSPQHPAKPGSPAAQDSRDQQNNPPGPVDQGGTGTTGTPQQTKTGDSAITTKPLSNGSPNEASKRPQRKSKHPHTHTSAEASSTNTAPSSPLNH